jgi:predicted ATPase/DNA-binding CsgD family transcriptional regulator
VGAEPKLTRRAMEVAELVALGLTNHEIAKRLFLSDRTVEWHIEQILNKLGFNSRSQIAAWVARSQATGASPALVSRPRGNLPAQLTSFVGRDRELRTLLDLVTANRLVTVVGAGGTGKTRLALRLAEELQSEFPDGVWLCDLAPVAEPSLVGDAVAQALELRRAARNRLMAVREHLKERSVLLVLDNCEHLLSSAAETTQELLAGCHGVRILATSRSPLGLIGEAICRLDPMPDEDAIQLFKDRAEVAAPNFQVDAGHGDFIAAICRRLDGVPLSIELVVPRLRVQSPTELAAALLDPAWQRPSGDRHGSLHAVADWSYRLMTAAEQSLFRRVGVFAGWFEGADAAAVAPRAGTQIGVLLGSLAERSMVIREQAEGASRYRLLDTLRAFAVQLLGEAGELDPVRLDHAEHMVSVVEAGGSGASAATRRKVTAMVDDVRAALTILLRERPERALLLSDAMMPTWRYEGRYQECLAWNDQTLAANPEPSSQRCRNLLQQAYTLIDVGRLEEAVSYLHQGEAIADSDGNEELRRQTLIVRANCHFLAGDFQPGLLLSQEALQAFEREGDEDRLAVARNQTAMTLLSMGRLREGASLARQALQSQLRATPNRMATLDTLAQAHALLGDLDQARQCWLEAVESGLEIGWKNGLPFCLFGLALVAGLEGDKESALRFHFAGERLNAEFNIRYVDPIARPEAELMIRLKEETGQEVAERLRSESEAQEPDMLLRSLIPAG